MANKLTDKQQLFVLHYLECLNGTKAARLAGYQGDDNTLAAIAYENLRKPHIRAAIDAELRRRSMGADEVLGRLSDMARADIGEFTGFDFYQIADHPKSRVIKKLKRTVRTDKDGGTTEYTEIELYDAQAALVHLGRYHKLFVDRVQQDDWRSQAIDDIKAGRIAYEALAEAFDDDLATELFRAAGIAVQVGESAE